MAVRKPTERQLLRWYDTEFEAHLHEKPKDRPGTAHIAALYAIYNRGFEAGEKEGKRAGKS